MNEPSTPPTPAMPQDPPRPHRLELSDIWFDARPREPVRLMLSTRCPIGVVGWDAPACFRAEVAPLMVLGFEFVTYLKGHAVYQVCAAAEKWRLYRLIGPYPGIAQRTSGVVKTEVPPPAPLPPFRVPADAIPADQVEHSPTAPQSDWVALFNQVRDHLEKLSPNPETLFLWDLAKSNADVKSRVDCHLGLLKLVFAQITEELTAARESSHATIDRAPA